MKKIIIAAFIIIFVVSPMFAQKKTTNKAKPPKTKDEVIQKQDNTLDSLLSLYFQKNKLNKFDEIKTIEIEGEMEILNNTYAFRMQYKPPHFFRVKERFQSQWIYRILNGKEMKAITKNGIIDITQQEIDVTYNLISYLKGFLTDYKKNGFELTYLGLDTISHLPEIPSDPARPVVQIPPFKIPKGLHHIIQIKTPTHETNKVYINKDNLNITLSTENPFMFAKIGAVKFDSYEESDGYIFPRRIEMISQVFPAIFRIQQITLNKEFPDSYFKLDSPENKWFEDE